MLRLIWRETAREEARAVFRYIAEHDVGAANRLIAAVEACAERLPEHPHMYRPGRVAGTREAVVHPNYILIYRVTAESVEIVNVVHARQRYP
ncbi:type II toxin-antitoxin system RelE/ParE family toxin [Sphingomonas sp.]|uniref:type II toxin-antitoxin system RelE/ParE family toxin n=1 Tax=Sphingomonas sp. TaxID=28214 RepID=UPI002DB5FC3E|nr:type II toxin-antitoxin system RelE/ParE family toxin [Sphingomonas sp.]HEU4967345.1 type II toxin-antitoxin system RelE/ParE family toxin [Sphingomonas sp.]